MRYKLGVGLILASVLPAAVSFAGPAHTLDCVSPRGEYELPHGQASLAIDVGPESAAWLEIEERGQSLKIEVEPAAEVLRLGVPPRYGRFLLESAPRAKVILTRTVPGRGSGSVRFALHCLPSGDVARRIEWFRAIAPYASPVGPTDDLVELLERLAGFAAQAPDASTHALALHLAAQVLLVNGRSAKAAQGFAQAETSWRLAGDSLRALVARVGRMEDLGRSGRYQEIVNLVDPRDQDASSYFAVRLKNSRCLALDYLGRIEQARHCYEWTIDKLERLEERTEYVNTLQNYAHLEIEAGESSKAEVLAKKALTLAVGVDAAIVRGRIDLLLADLALAHADVAAALRLYDEALEEFAVAQSPRWEANTLLGVARIYRQLGASDEAYSAVDSALRRISAGDAPAFVAAALGVLSSIDRGNDRLDQALRWAAASERIYANLNAPDEYEASLIATALIELRLGKVDEAASALKRSAVRRPDNAVERSILGLELAIEQGNIAISGKRLAELRVVPLTLLQSVSVAQLEARYWRKQGKSGRADSVLRQAMLRIRELARSTSSRLLGHFILRQSQDILRTAFNDVLEDSLTVVGARGVDDAWEWLMQSKAEDLELENPAAPSGMDAARFDAAVAGELLGPATEKLHSVPQRALLKMLAKGETSAQPKSTAKFGPDWRTLQGRLGADSVFVAYLDGDNRSALLFVTSASAQLVETSQRSTLRDAISELRTQLRVPTSPVKAIDAASEHLSNLIWRSLPPTPAPKTLLVLAGSPLDGVPWASIRWPGSAESMLDTSTVRIVTVDDLRTESPIHNSPSMHVVVASQNQSLHPSLLTLAGASMEPTLISGVVTDRSIAVVGGSDATREALLLALNRPDAWVHIAAHGFARPARIGYAGIWLDPGKTDEAPQFVSWLDIMERGVRAGLVVLNACELANNGDAVNGNLSFASAVSQAGAKQVVASLWPVSDAASAIWVPAFYAALVADPAHDAAEALRTAQLKLRSRRAFRHPFYWAGMQTFARLSIPGTATAKDSLTAAGIRSH